MSTIMKLRLTLSSSVDECFDSRSKFRNDLHESIRGTLLKFYVMMMMMKELFSLNKLRH